MIAHKMLKTNKLCAVAFNPPSRVAPAALTTLSSSVSKKGILHALDVVDRGDGFFTIADGHRRHAIAVSLKIDEVPCTIHVAGTNVPDLWAELNRNTKSISTLAWMDAWHRANGDMKDKTVPPNVMAHIRGCIKIFGKSIIPVLIEKRLSPGIQALIYRLHNRMVDVFHEQAPSAATIGHWMIEHRGCQLMVGTLFHNDGLTSRMLKKLKYRIASDKPITWEDLVPGSRRKGT